MNYAAKLSNFNAVNMGQISSNYIGNTSRDIPCQKVDMVHRM